MKKQFTETELITKVGTFYKGALYFEKALKLFEFEYGFEPKIVKANTIVDEDWVQTQGYPWFVTAESLTFMKELQMGGTVNMFGATPSIQQALGLDRNDARKLLTIYMEDYDKIYFPENRL